MKIKRFLSALLVLLMVLTAIPSVFVSADEYEIVKDGLVSYYDGVKNTKAGHSANATVWEDLAGDNDITVEKSAKNYFTDTAFHVSGSKFNFPAPIMTLINTNEFTVEMKVGEIAKTGSSYTTMINSSANDNFALFLRTSGDYIEFKSSTNARPKVPGGKEYVADSTLAITYSLKDKLCVMYVDGIEIGSVALTTAIGAQGSLFFGHNESSKVHTADYEGFRFYSRALTADEVATNAKADGNYDFNYVPPREFSKVEQAATNIAGGIAFSEVIDTEKEISELFTRETKPAVAIFYVDSSLKITDAQGKQIGSYDLTALEEASNNSVIPAFYVKDEATVKALCAALDSIGYEDCFIASSDPALIKLSRTTYPIARGIVDLSAKYADKNDLSEEELLEIRKTVNSALAKVVILPQSVGAKEDIAKLGRYGMSTWLKADDGLESKKDALYLLLSSAYGIVSDNTALLVDVGTNSLVSGTLARMPVNIGHRGTAPSVASAPENTVENALISYENGADAIEVDIYLTADKEIVINHNSTTTNMKVIKNGTAVSWSIGSKSLKQLKGLYYAGYYEKNEDGSDKLDENGNKIEYTGFQISTLKELFEAFKGKDVQLVIEFKSGKSNIVPIFKEIVEEYEMYDQVTVIAYESTGQHKAMVEHFPEMTVGLLYGTIPSNAQKADESLKEAVRKVQEHNGTLNPSYSGFAAPYVRAATYRGVTVWPYTINNQSQIHSSILYGYTAITGDYSGVIGALTKYLNVTFDDHALPGSTLNVKAEVTSYKRETTDATAKAVLTVIEGEELIEKTDGLSIELKDGAAGEICFLVSYEQKLDAGKSYTIYTQPLTVNVSNDSVDPEPSPSVEDDTTPSDLPADPSESLPATEDEELPSLGESTPENSDKGDEDDKDDKDGLPISLIIAIPVVILLVVGVVIAVVIVSKKKK